MQAEADRKTLASVFDDNVCPEEQKRGN